MSVLKNAYRRLRVLRRQRTGAEPVVRRTVDAELEFHGTEQCGWNIPRGMLNARSVVVDVGLGEDISFSQSLADKFGLVVHGFDPTPRAIAYVKGLKPNNFVLHEVGIGVRSGVAQFFLPNDDAHVSGSLVAEGHVGQRKLDVTLLTIGEIFRRLGTDRIDVLKLDIEGAEYELISSAEFAEYANRIGMICIEFHHRWRSFGKDATLRAVSTLKDLGFHCAWGSASTNEEFLFVRPATPESVPL